MWRPRRRCGARCGRGAGRRPAGLAATACYVAGGLLLVWSAYVHFHLWGETDGYRSIPTIGPLFLLQSIAGLVIGLGVIAVRRVWAAVIGVGFALSTLAGFVISVAHGLFGFKDSWLAPYAKEAFMVEVIAGGPARRRRGSVPPPVGSPHARRSFPCRRRNVGTTPDRACVPISRWGAGPASARCDVRLRCTDARRRRPLSEAGEEVVPLAQVHRSSR